MASLTRTRSRPSFDLGRLVRIALGVSLILLVLWQLRTVLLVNRIYGLDNWTRFAISGIILGSVYAVIALGYTLVYGILFMINFAHGEVMMLGAFAGFFALSIADGVGMLNANLVSSIASIVFAFIAGTLVAMGVAVALERIAYRPLRGAPRLVPLISAIGASLFLQNTAQLLFGPAKRPYRNPEILKHYTGWTMTVSDKKVVITYTGALVVVLSILLMVGLYVLVQRTKMGKAMRAVAEDKQVAALMGIDVDRVIAITFAISGVLAGAAGVMWGLHLRRIDPFVGFLPGLKAFTAAVLGGIGNIPGAMLGGLSLGVMEAMAPAILNVPDQLKDVLAFSILVLVLIFRPTGLLGEVLAEKKA
jgi:branched-chain amino acid transport system permease protein